MDGGIRERAISPEEARDWLVRNLARLPERDDAWYARVLNICNPGVPEAANLVSHGDT